MEIYKPVLFNSDMVQALLDGRKEVTRRVVKPQPAGQLHRMPDSMCWSGYFANSEEENVYKPPYQPGNILWVREAFSIDYLSNIPGRGRVRYKAGGYMDIRFSPDRYDMMRRAQKKPGWRPSKNMLREAARIFLRVTNVYVKRLRDVNYFDCLAEGIPYRQMETDIVQDFAALWDQTISSKDRPLYGWEANPYIWVIEFEHTAKPDRWPC